MSSANDIHWYVGYVKSCQEKKAAEFLTGLGIENYLPVQKVARKWSDRVKLIDRLVIPRMIFVRTDPATRIKLLESHRYITRFMTSGGPYNPVVVPDEQLALFKFMVTRSKDEVEMLSAPPAPGDRVKVIDGPMAGLECDVVSIAGKARIYISVGLLGCASVEVDIRDVEKV